MRILRRHRGPVEGRDHQNFWIYDETKTEDKDSEARIREKFPFPPAGLTDEQFYPSMVENCRRSSKILWGAAADHPMLAHVVIYRDGRIEFEFDDKITYSLDDLKLMQSKARAARKRLVFK